MSAERLQGLIALALGVALAGAALAQGRPPAQTRRAPVQCWTDDRGQRVCGDVVPPAEARRQRELIDRRGVVTGVVPAQRTAEQAQAEARARRERQRREAYDRYLVQAYSAVPDIERARDERLADLAGRLRLAEKGRADTARSLADLRTRVARAADAQVDGAAASPDPALAAKIAEFERAEDDHIKAIARIHDEQARIRSEFARDIERFRELKAGRGG